MEPLVYLSRAEVARLMPPVTTQLDLVERAYRALAAGQVEMPPKPGVHPRPDAFIHAMPAWVQGDDAVAVKWVSGYPGNPERGLPYISGVIVVNDADTGLPLAVMDAAEITAARTAAASGACARRLAPDGWRRAAILGCGEQGRFHADVLRELGGPDAEIAVFDPRPERAALLGPQTRPERDARTAVERAQVVVTAGPIVRRPQPVVAPEWLADEHLVLPIDFDALVTAAAIEHADLVLADDIGQYEYYRDKGHFGGWPTPHASVGQALTDGVGGRRVVCVNLGVAALDAVFAAAVLKAARQSGAGTELPR